MGEHAMKNLIQFLLAALLILPLAALAKDISLYDTPDANAKAVGKIDIAAGIVPIFSSKDGKWMKVGDPRNGNVGWIKSDDLTNSDGSTSFTFTQRVINDGKAAKGNTVQYIQFGNEQNKLTAEQTKQYIEKLQLQQLNMQRDMQNTFQRMMKDMNSVYNMDTSAMIMTPMIVPVVIVPTQKTQTPVKPATQKTPEAATVKKNT